MEQDPPAFWFQPPLATNRRRSPPIDPVVLIILLPILALIFLFFFLPPFLSYTSHILKSGSVNPTWDSFNILLVLFAILCGVLARRNDDAADQANGFVAMSRISVESSGQWDGFSDRRMVVTGGLRRSSSSYPDLRQESLWDNGENRNRFLDDFHVDMYSSPVSRYYSNLSGQIERESLNLYQSTPASDEIRQRSRRSEVDSGEFSDVKEILVDTFKVSSTVSEFREQTPVASPPPLPPAPSANSRMHSFQSVGRDVNEVPAKIESDELVNVRSYHHPPHPPQPPPLPPPPTEMKLQRSHQKHKKLERKVSDATKEIATAISSLYNQRKRKNKRKLRKLSSGSDASPPSIHSIPSADLKEPPQSLVPLPPPPPPPPPSMFHNLFKKGGKHKRIHSVPATVSPTVPPPPPPPPPSSIFNNLFKSGNKSKRFHSPYSARPLPPPLPPSSIMNNLFRNGTTSNRFNSITATSSPPTPPPPPPPMTPPRYTNPVKSEQVSKRKSQAQSPPPPSPPISESLIRRSTSKGKPPLPTKASSYYDRDDFLPSGSQSPLIPMPPPPPPFRVPSMKFELRGDFVRVRSTHSSVCSSPDRDDVDLPSTLMDGGDSIGPRSGPGTGPLFFPSPDVNAKADSFISRLKDEWRMERISAVKEKMG